MVDSLVQDLRFALRTLRKNRGFAAAAVLTLALGIGATTTVYSVAYGVLLQALPYPGADRIVSLAELNARGRPIDFADPNFYDIKEQNHSLTSFAQYSHRIPLSISG